MADEGVAILLLMQGRPLNLAEDMLMAEALAVVLAEDMLMAEALAVVAEADVSAAWAGTMESIPKIWLL